MRWRWWWRWWWWRGLGRRLGSVRVFRAASCVERQHAISVRCLFRQPKVGESRDVRIDSGNFSEIRTAGSRASLDRKSDFIIGVVVPANINLARGNRSRGQIDRRFRLRSAAASSATSLCCQKRNRPIGKHGQNSGIVLQSGQRRCVRKLDGCCIQSVESSPYPCSADSHYRNFVRCGGIAPKCD